MTAQSAQLETVGRSSKFDQTTVLALLVGMAPLLGGILFRTHQYHVESSWYEALRQLDMPYILIELGVVLWAHEKGLNFKGFFKKLDRSYQLAMALFLTTFAVGSLIYAPIPGYSLLRASYWLIHIGFALSVWHLLKEAPADTVNKISDAMVAGLAIFVPLLIGHFVLAPDPADTKLGQIIWSSAVPGCLSVRHFGLWTGAVLALWLGRSGWLQGNGSGRWWHWAVTTMLMALMMWSGTRAAIVGVFAALMVACFAMVRWPTFGSFAKLVGATLLGIALSALAFTPDSSFGVLDLGRMFGDPSANANAISSGRMDIWKAVLTKFSESPLFGWGEGAMFWNVKLETGAHLQPHNSIVQFLFSWGAIATAAAAFVMIRALWTLHSNVRHVPTMLAPLMLVDCTLVMSLFDGVLYFSRMIMLGAMGMALCFALLSAHAAKKDRLV